MRRVDKGGVNYSEKGVEISTRNLGMGEHCLLVYVANKNCPKI